MKVQGYDSAYPDNVAETSITIDIIRNAPSNSTIDKTTSENTGQKKLYETFYSEQQKGLLCCNIEILGWFRALIKQHS